MVAPSPAICQTCVSRDNPHLQEPLPLYKSLTSVASGVIPSQIRKSLQICKICKKFARWTNKSIIEALIILNYSARPFIFMCQSLILLEYVEVVTLTEKLLSFLITKIFFATMLKDTSKALMAFTVQAVWLFIAYIFWKREKNDFFSFFHWSYQILKIGRENYFYSHFPQSSSCLEAWTNPQIICPILYIS